MPLSWISRAQGDDVDTLVARGKYVKAARTLRAAFEGRQPTLAERLRYADLLVLAQQGQEALPVLLGVADEQARYGFRDKAMEALRRAQAIDAGDPKVRQYLRTLEKAREREGASTQAPPANGEDTWDAALDGAFGASAAEAVPGEGSVNSAEAPSPTSPDAPSPETATVLCSGEDDMVIPESDLEPEDFEPGPTGDAGTLEAMSSTFDEAEEELELVEIPGEPASEELRPLLTESDLDSEDAGPAPAAGDLDTKRLHSFLLLLGRTQGKDGPGLGAALFADFSRRQVRRIARGMRRRRFAPGDVLVTEGDPGHSVFLIARGSVRILVRGGHGQPFDVRRLDEGDSFGEVAVLKGWPRTATVVAATPCDVLEVGRRALDALLAARPAARRLLEQLAASRAESPEEKAVRSLPPEAADPERAAEALRAHFGGSEWSFRVRLHLAQLMLDVGRQDEALAVLASVAEDLARNGHAQKAIAVLKKVELIRRRGVVELPLAPPRKGRRRSARPRPAPSTGSRPLLPVDASAAERAAFREWVGQMLRQTHALVARPAVSHDGDEDGEGEEAHHSLAQQSAF